MLNIRTAQQFSLGAGVKVAGVAYGSAQGVDVYDPTSPLADNQGMVRKPGTGPNPDAKSDGPSGLAALRSQLVASGWPYHVRASVTPAPATPPAPAKSAGGPEPGAVTAPRRITARAGQGAGRRRLQGRDFPQ